MDIKNFLNNYYWDYNFSKKKNIQKRKSQDSSWMEKYEFLHIFKEIYGHVNVPQRYHYDSCLGAWVGKQRGYFSKFKLSRTRTELLNFLKFEWVLGKSFTFGAAWSKRFEELKYFKEIYGHCNVPCKYLENKELGFWVKNQRQFYKKKILEENRIFLLNILGFEWTRRESSVKLSWYERYLELRMYISHYGNGLVPQRSGALGKWVQKQRDLYRKNQIKKERKDLLDMINFVWEPRGNLNIRVKFLGMNFSNPDFFYFPENRIEPGFFPLENFNI